MRKSDIQNKIRSHASFSFQIEANRFVNEEILLSYVKLKQSFQRENIPENIWLWIKIVSIGCGTSLGSVKQGYLKRVFVPFYSTTLRKDYLLPCSDIMNHHQRKTRTLCIGNDRSYRYWKWM